MPKTKQTKYKQRNNYIDTKMILLNIIQNLFQDSTWLGIICPKSKAGAFNKFS